MLQTTTNVNIDFYDKKYILINAKQLDRSSRFLSVTCYNHGEIYPVNAGEHSAYIRYKKADGNSVFNSCEIDNAGRVIVELTEQMLASDGICCADLLIANKGDAKVDSQTGEIIGLDNAAILSTMLLHIDVVETATENANIESSYEFSGLNAALEKAEADYEEVMKTSKSWAVGGTGIRSGEDTDNAKYYAKQSSNSASAASASASNAANSENNAKQSENNAKQSEDSARQSENSAMQSENSARQAEDGAKQSEDKARSYAQDARQSMDIAEDCKDDAYDYSIISKRYAVGGTNTAVDEDIDNAKYYYEQVRNITIGASVIGVKGNNETDYRRGNVNLTADNIGAVATTDIATVDEAKDYLGI